MRIAMLVHSYFPNDPRVRKEAQALEAERHEVEVFCLRGEDDLAEDECGTIAVHRMSVSRRRSRGRLGYLLEYLRFFVLGAYALSSAHLHRPFDVVHVHNIPDELVFAAVVPKLRGARVVLDMHDPMPELFADKYGKAEDSRMIRLLTRLQLACARFADHVIVSSELFKERLVSRGIAPGDVSVVVNGAELEPVDDEPFVMAYHGSLFPRYGLETVIRGMASVKDRLPDVELLVFQSDVDPAYLRRLQQLAERLGVDDRVAFSGRLYPLALRRTLGMVDLGLVPARPSAHMDLVYPTKLFDYLSAGVPVLVAKTPPIERKFGDALHYYEPESVADFGRALVAIAEELRDVPRTNRRSLLPRELEWAAIAPVAVEAVADVPPAREAPPEAETVLAAAQLSEDD